MKNLDCDEKEAKQEELRKWQEQHALQSTSTVAKSKHGVSKLMHTYKRDMLREVSN